jgi:hypothetical protein
LSPSAEVYGETRISDDVVLEGTEI